ncbi:carbohydrate ABC transporter permease [Rhodococcus koreensis]|uniref:carbohydrate ABC transporter permease n=1 Tax=Rhodococcus koreensis TaxID=99653 RepID=UPI00366BD035
MTTTLVRRTETGTSRGPAARRSSRARRETLTGYLFLLPWLVGFFLIVAGPVLASLYLSFTDYSILGVPHLTGFDNYIRMFTDDPRFWASLTVTLVYLLVSVPLVAVAALFLALILDRGVRGLPVYRAVFYLPSLIGGSVAIAILWRFLFGGDGLFNAALGVLGIDSNQSWIGTPDTALGTLVVLNVWQFGAPMIIFLAGLRQIPAELYEAARVDGAGALRQFRSITLPMLSPIIFFNVLMGMVNAFQAFNTAYIVSNGTGGPADSTLFFTLYIYQRAFTDFEMGYAAALGWVLLLVSAAATSLLFLASRRLVFYGDR